jgi:Permease family
VLAGFLNSFPDTAFAENVGLVGLTRVRSRWVVSTCGGTRRPKGESAVSVAVREGAVAVNVPDDGASVADAQLS